MLLRGLKRLFLGVQRFIIDWLPYLQWYNWIDETIAMGGVLRYTDLDKLKAEGIRAVVNLCHEFKDNEDKLKTFDMDYLWIPVIDYAPPTLDQIMRTIQWIEARVKENKRVYVHCAVGAGRSATIVICWYIYQGLTATEAVNFVKTRRPQILPSRSQLNRILEFELLRLQIPEGDWLAS